MKRFPTSLFNKSRATTQPAVFSFNLSPLSSRLLVLVIAALLCGASYALWLPQLRTIETRLGNLGWTLNSDNSPEARFSIVAIDEKSIAQIGPWPWPREVLATLSDKLRQAGVSLQVYDIVFPEAKEDDDTLLSALTKTSSVIAQIPDLVGTQPLKNGVMTGNLKGMRCQKPMPNSANYLANHSRFKLINKGHITPILDNDGAIYQVPPLICVDGQVYPHLAISALLQGLSIASSQAKLIANSEWLSPAWSLRFEDYPELNIPLDEQGNVRLSYGRHPSSFQVIPAVDILNDRVDLSLLDNTWAQIGATAFGLGDVVPTPYSAATPGIELHARMLSSLLDNDLVSTPRLAPYFLFTLAVLFSVILLSMASSSRKWALIARPSAVVLLPLAALALHLLLLQSSLWLGWILPALYTLIAASLLALLEHSRTRIERQRIYNNLNSYLPENTVQEIAFTLPSGAVVAERKNLTLLCADLRNFSAYQEALPAEQAASVLHYFFVKACSVIEQHGGQIHEFKGDAVLATWPADAVPSALKASKALQASTDHFLPSNSFVHSDPQDIDHSQELAPLALGIGIEQGSTLVGSIGPAHRRTHTLLGETVTLVLRIQEMTADLAQPILIGANAAKQITDESIESQGDYLLDGLLKPHTLFALTPDDYQDANENQSKTPFTLLQGGLS